MTPNKPLTVTVSQLNRRISVLLAGEKSFEDLCVRGEISNLTIHYKSGHIYFSLKDETAAVKAVMFRSNAQKLDFLPENGMKVVVRGSIQCYERDGVYQIYANDIIPEGVGQQAIAFEQLKKRLDEEGLFSQNRPIPQLPNKIAVVTSETGAALQDILNILNRRYPLVKVVLIPVTVQGEKAPTSIADGIAAANQTDADVIIFGRGGGSAEDLSAFNTELVARAVFASKIPTISAVGHEIDFSISDFAADLRAPTPSAAAELAVPEKESLCATLDSCKRRISNQFLSILEKKQSNSEYLYEKIRAKNPIQVLRNNEQLLATRSAEISAKIHSLINSREQQLYSRAAVISALNPLDTLLRGYSITYKDGAVLSSVNKVKNGDEIKVRVSDGEITAVVSSVNSLKGTLK